jgi:hypothetical protein
MLKPGIGFFEKGVLRFEVGLLRCEPGLLRFEMQTRARSISSSKDFSTSVLNATLRSSGRLPRRAGSSASAMQK